jgi:hypothetical protein
MAMQDKTDQTPTRDQNKALEGPQERPAAPPGPHAPTAPQTSPGGSPETQNGAAKARAHHQLFHHLLYGWSASEPVATQLLNAHRNEVLAGNYDAAAERDCLAMAVQFALQWTPDAPMSLREGIEEILATMPAAEADPEFFRPGHTYNTTIFGGPFTVDFVGTQPGTGERFAHGWVHYEHDNSWTPNVVTGLFDRFTDITEGGETR